MIIPWKLHAEMSFRRAEVVDVLRSTQRDDLAIREIEENIQTIFKYFGHNSNYRTLKKYFHPLSTFWYYYITSGNNLQTLGEEYANILRFSDLDTIPSRFTQLVWLTLYIGGEPLLNRLVNYSEVQVRSSSELREEARETLLNFFNFFKTNRCILSNLHRSIFYITALNYTIPHRLTGIKYVILRNWMVDKSFVKGFKMLGYISLIYSLVNIFGGLWKLRMCSAGFCEVSERASGAVSTENSTKLCILCNEERRIPSVTPCGHIFCWNCIHESLEYQQKCPLCREDVQPSRIIALRNYF